MRFASADTSRVIALAMNLPQTHSRRRSRSSSKWTSDWFVYGGNMIWPNHWMYAGHLPSDSQVCFASWDVAEYHKPAEYTNCKELEEVTLQSYPLAQNTASSTCFCYCSSCTSGQQADWTFSCGLYRHVLLRLEFSLCENKVKSNQGKKLKVLETHQLTELQVEVQL